MIDAADFRSAHDAELGRRFLEDGYVIGEVEDGAALERLRTLLVEAAVARLGCAYPDNSQVFLDTIGNHVPSEQLNEFRLALIGALNAARGSRAAYFNLARSALEAIVGNELCIQRRINLSVQLPEDDSSLLALHADTWSGDSPFEVVLWIPFTDCYRTKSMYILPPAHAAGLELRDFEAMGAEGAFQSIAAKVTWVDITYGQYLLFNQNLPHGNRVNKEAAARWSANCRFKGVFTPYADKRLGEFFEPITLRPASHVGLAYQLPGGFNE